MPPTLPISAMLGFPPKSSVKAGRNTSENRPKSVASSDQPAHATKNTSHWYRVTPRTKPSGPPTPSIVPIVLIRRCPFLPGLRRGRLTRHSPNAGTYQGHGLAFGPPAQPNVAQDGCPGEGLDTRHLGGQITNGWRASRPLAGTRIETPAVRF